MREALLSLLQEKELNEIAISELCKTADVNRNTFYRHYSIPLDILLEIEDAVFEKLSAVLGKSTNMDDVILLSCQLLESDNFNSTHLLKIFEMIPVLLKSFYLYSKLSYHGKIVRLF